MLDSKTLLTLKNGDVLRHILAGAGGWGNPFERDVQKVLVDVRDEKFSVEYVEREYGVAIDSETMQIDMARTEQLRKGILPS